MNTDKLKVLGPMLFLKFSLLMAVVLSLTVVKPIAYAAHSGTQKICSIVMDSNDCTKHC
jgi:hypothetical protein